MNNPKIGDVRLLASLARRVKDPSQPLITLRRGTVRPGHLAPAIRAGMWFFLGVEIDEASFQPRSVHAVRLHHEEEEFVLLLNSEDRRLISAFRDDDGGIARIEDHLSALEVEVQWEGIL